VSTSEAPLKAPDEKPEAPLKAPDEKPEAPLKAPDEKWDNLLPRMLTPL
jgi:hypothetical protein